MRPPEETRDSNNMSRLGPLDRVRIVLVGTSHPGNIGSAARALKTMGLTRLVLVARGVTPGLAVIIVGDDPASKVYVANKVKACNEVGLQSTVYAYPADTPDAEVEAKILSLNADPTVHGILVQLPLPKHFDGKRVLA
ncbi:MAG: hypothetical protein HC807_02765, partial [Gammaproteobacteria bacterium]|nr:hypothetical protein [Gammaproteobacteria bacterium]